MSNRAYYLAMLQSSSEYIFNLYDEVQKDSTLNSNVEKENKSIANIKRIKHIQAERASMTQGASGLIDTFVS